MLLLPLALISKYVPVGKPVVFVAGMLSVDNGLGASIRVSFTTKSHGRFCITYLSQIDCRSLSHLFSPIPGGGESRKKAKFRFATSQDDVARAFCNAEGTSSGVPVIGTARVA